MSIEAEIEEIFKAFQEARRNNTLKRVVTESDLHSNPIWLLSGYYISHPDALKNVVARLTTTKEECDRTISALDQLAHTRNEIHNDIEKPNTEINSFFNLGERTTLTLIIAAGIGTFLVTLVAVGIISG